MESSRKLERLRGYARRETVRRGTGSEHCGVRLETGGGERPVLVRIGGKPFDDPEVQKLCGHTVEVEGYRVGSEFRFVNARTID